MLVVLDKQFSPFWVSTGMKTWFICPMTTSLIQVDWTNEESMTPLLLLQLPGKDQSEIWPYSLSSFLQGQFQGVQVL